MTIVIDSFMTVDLGLRGVDLLVYSLVYSYSQDAQGCYYGGVPYASKHLGCSEQSVRNAFGSLTSKGLIKCHGMRKETKTNEYSIDPSKILALTPSKNLTLKNFDPQKNSNPPSSLSPQTPYIYLPQEDNNIIRDNKTISCGNAPLATAGRGGSDAPLSEAVQRLYDLYPSRCLPDESYPKGRPTGKSGSDKRHIEKLLRSGRYTEESLSSIIRQYVSEETRGRYKNLSTFLNNIPDYGDALDVSTPETRRESKYAKYQ